MLPSKYLSGSSKAAQPPAAPPLGITGVLCHSSTLQIPGRGSLHYTVYRPRLLLSSNKKNGLPPGLTIPPPLLCVAGGPGMPCQYLSALIHTVADRAVLLYDHMGCGQSTANSKLPTETFLADMVNDLKLLIDNVFSDHSFHLLGHSMGGIVAFEYLKMHEANNCSSIVMSSAPTSIQGSHDSRVALCKGIKEEGFEAEEIALEFQKRHMCRVYPMPLPLLKSLESLKNQKMDPNVLHDYVASEEEAKLSTPALILRGQYDFVTSSWTSFFEDSQTIVLSGCSHYGMVENEELYGTVLTTFLRDHDNL